MCPLALIAGFVDAIAGGGGLISLPAYFFAGLPPHAAIATNKLSSTLGTLVATVRYALFGYMVKRFVVAGVACGLVGSAIGANLALLADATVLTVVMLVALPPVAFLVFRSKNLDRFAERPLPPRLALAATALIALAVGVYDGFYGPGTGTILMLLLAAVAHQDVRTAAGTTKAINLATNVAALAVFLVNGAVLIPLGLAAAASIALMLVVLLVPPFIDAFGGTTMDLGQWALVVGFALLSVVQTEIAKAIGRWRARR